MKVHDENWAMGRPFGSINNHKDGGRLAYKTGEYNHINGTVLIYQQGYKREDGITDNKYLMLTIYKDGRGYYRTIRGKVYTDIGIARKAGEFAKEIYLKNSPINDNITMFKDWFHFHEQEDGKIGMANCPNCGDTVIYNEGCISCDANFEFKENV